MSENKTVLERIRRLTHYASRLDDKNGVDINFQDFLFLLKQGGIFDFQNRPYVDNCYLHKLNFKDHLFKTLTERRKDFYF